MAELYNYKDPVPVLMYYAKKLMEILVLQVSSPLGDFLSCAEHNLYFCIRTFYLHLFLLFCIVQYFKSEHVFKNDLFTNLFK